MKFNILAGVGLVALMACSQANAFDTYIGLGVSNNTGETKDKDEFKIDQGGVSYDVTLGATLTNHIALELFYTKFGSDTGSIADTNIKQAGYGLDLNYRRAVYNDIYGVASVGMQRIESSKTLYRDNDFGKISYDSNTKFDVKYGVGVGYRVTDRVNFEVKYSRFQDMNSVGGKFIYRF